MKASMAFRVGFLFASLLMGAYAVELASTLLKRDPFVTVVAQAEADGRPFDPRSSLEVVRDLRADGKRAYPRLTPAALRKGDPEGPLRSVLNIEGRETLVLSGVSRASIAVCNELGSWMVFESDEHGFNNPSGLWGADSVRVVAVGDSIVLGHCVPERDNAIGQLRKRIPATLNLGYSGHSPGFILASIVEYAARVEPRHVLWFHSENDLEWYEVGEDARTPLIMRYVEQEAGTFNQGLFDRRGAIDEAVHAFVDQEMAGATAKGIPALADDVRGTALSRLTSVLALKRVRGVVSALTAPHPPAKQSDPDLYARMLARAKQVVEAWGGQLHLVYVPGAQEFALRDTGRDESYAAARSTVRATAEKLALPLLDLYEYLGRLDDPQSLYAFRGHSALEGYGVPHPTADGYAKIAEAVHAHLLRYDDAIRDAEVSTRDVAQKSK